MAACVLVVAGARDALEREIYGVIDGYHVIAMTDGPLQPSAFSAVAII